MRTRLARAAMVLAVAWTGALAAPQTPQQQNGVSYLNGGVGAEEQGAMRAQRTDYNLQLTFASRSGAYRSDVQLDIADARGKTVLSVANAGPLFYAQLAPGTYRISAAAEGKTFKRTVKVGNAPRELTLHWEDDSPDDPGARE